MKCKDFFTPGPPMVEMSKKLQKKCVILFTQKLMVLLIKLAQFWLGVWEGTSWTKN